MKSQHQKDMEAVRIDGDALCSIKNQTNEIVLAAVFQNGTALRYVKDQTTEIALVAVTQNGWAIRYVTNQTPEISLAAVTQNGLTLERVKSPTREIVLAAVTENGNALRYVKDQTQEIALAAVCQDGWSLEFVKNKTPEIELAAVSNNGLAIEYVRDQIPEIVLAAVSNNSDALQFAEKQTHEIILAAVSLNGYSIEYAKEVSQEIILAAWRQAGDDLLNFSAGNNLIDTIDFLISRNVLIDHVSNKEPCTPFQLAASNLNKDVLLMLNNNGANIHVRDNYSQRNMLSEVIAKFQSNINRDKCLQTINTLLEIGVSPTDQDKNGETAMILAKDKPEILAILKAFELKKIITSTISTSQQSTVRFRNSF
jgi:hypothetical protein